MFFKRPTDEKETVPAVTVVDVEAAPPPTGPEWRPSVHEVLIMIVLSTISLMVSLDACIIVTSLSVSNPKISLVTFIHVRLLSNDKTN
jgi:hypothetical protein